MPIGAMWSWPLSDDFVPTARRADRQRPLKAMLSAGNRASFSHVDGKEMLNRIRRGLIRHRTVAALQLRGVWRSYPQGQRKRAPSVAQRTLRPMLAPLLAAK